MKCHTKLCDYNEKSQTNIRRRKAKIIKAGYHGFIQTLRLRINSNLLLEYRSIKVNWMFIYLCPSLKWVNLVCSSSLGRSSVLYSVPILFRVAEGTKRSSPSVNDSRICNIFKTNGRLDLKDFLVIVLNFSRILTQGMNQHIRQECKRRYAYISRLNT